MTETFLNTKFELENMLLGILINKKDELEFTVAYDIKDAREKVVLLSLIQASNSLQAMKQQLELIKDSLIIYPMVSNKAKIMYYTIERCARKSLYLGLLEIGNLGELNSELNADLKDLITLTKKYYVKGATQTSMKKLSNDVFSQLRDYLMLEVTRDMQEETQIENSVGHTIYSELRNYMEKGN